MKSRICIGLAVFATALMYPAAAWAAVTFAPAANYAADSGPISIDIGDVNGDGNPDLVTANQVSNNVSVLLGNGDGTFAAATNLPVGSTPNTVVIDDLNGDSKPDLATANSADATFSVLLGNGDGTFAAATAHPTGDNVNWIASGDLNGDGKPDLATATVPSDKVSVLLGNGDGTFAAAVHYPAAVDTFMVTIADVNSDSKPDVVTSNTAVNTVGILLGNGDGTLAAATQFPVGDFPTMNAVDDFNGDGKIDLVTVNGAGNVSVLIGNGDGTFGPPASYATGPQPNAVAVGDFDGDGKADLAVPSAVGNTVGILLGNGDGTFAIAASPAVGSVPFSVGIGDFNGDGAQDVTTGSFGGGTVSVLLNSTEFPFTVGPTATISGTARQGTTLTAGEGSPDPTPDSFAYEWFADGVTIGGETAKTLTLGPAQVGKKISVTVTAKKAGLDDASSTSAETAAVQGIFTPGPKASISGDARIGSVLIARPGSPSPAPTSYVYRWYADGKLLATKTRYLKVTTAHAYKRIQVKIWAVKAGYLTASSLSAPTTPVNNLQAKVLSMELNDYSVRRGQRVYAEIDRLAPSEPFSIVLDGTKLASGKANTRGEAVVGFTIPVKATVGARILRAYGMFTDRTDPDRITIR